MIQGAWFSTALYSWHSTVVKLLLLLLFFYYKRANWPLTTDFLQKSRQTTRCRVSSLSLRHTIS